MNLSRRDMLASLGGGVCMAGSAMAGRVAGQKKIGVALQLYSVRNHCKKDFDNTLEQVSAMGYEAVEFAGYYKYSGDPAGLKKKLDSLNLKVAGSHVGANLITPERIERFVEFHTTIGCAYAIVPHDGRMYSPDHYKKFADYMIGAAERLKPHGICTGYHNHAKEFGKVDGKTYWEHFADSTPKEMVLQQDVGWTTHAGQDPVAFIKKYPGRTKTTHFKPTVVRGDQGKQPILGKDSVKWPEIIEACYDVGGTDWFIVEQESYLPGVSPLECSKLSLTALKAILAGRKKG